MPTKEEQTCLAGYRPRSRPKLSTGKPQKFSFAAKNQFPLRPRVNVGVIMNEPRTKAVAYCTYFDTGYLSRGLTMIESLRHHGDNALVFILALDSGVRDFFADYGDKNIQIISLQDLEEFEPRLSIVRPQRSRVEFYFTCTPLLVRFAMDQMKTLGATIIYLDADLYFFDQPQLAITSLGDGSVGIIEHRYPKRLERRLSKYGRFNVGWVAFVDDEQGREVLDWYGKSTLEWCGDKPLDGKYADQGYLDSFPLFAGVTVLREGAFNLAPWNTESHDVRFTPPGTVTVDGKSLNFFHFHGLRSFGGQFVTGQILYGAKLTQALKQGVYLPYVLHLSRNEIVIESKMGGQVDISKRGSGLSGILGGLRRSALALLSSLARNSVRVPRNI
ncbi:hypothetical protein GM51_4440 [freshwater metagenome]|uniref:Nucleotide-diphospho-sugar transferase domain-containing protein n=1 Tax=freshwater metagenome TaxID=449393 RepID=A0A094R259_9ZZZZ